MSRVAIHKDPAKSGEHIYNVYPLLTPEGNLHPTPNNIIKKQFVEKTVPVKEGSSKMKRITVPFYTIYDIGGARWKCSEEQAKDKIVLHNPLTRQAYLWNKEEVLEHYEIKDSELPAEDLLQGKTAKPKKEPKPKKEAKKK